MAGYSEEMGWKWMRPALTALLFLLLGLGCQPPPATPVEPGTSSPPAAIVSQPTPPPVQQAIQQLQTRGPSFRSRGSFEDHYSKHGREFGSVSADEYLALAQRLRDTPVSDEVLEIVREVDGVITRYDRSNQHFGAYNRDGTIRTFFIPNDGESYFRRQALRRPQ